MHLDSKGLHGISAVLQACGFNVAYSFFLDNVFENTNAAYQNIDLDLKKKLNNKRNLIEYWWY